MVSLTRTGLLEFGSDSSFPSSLPTQTRETGNLPSSLPPSSLVTRSVRYYGRCVRLMTDKNHSDSFTYPTTLTDPHFPRKSLPQFLQEKLLKSIVRVVGKMMFTNEIWSLSCR